MKKLVIVAIVLLAAASAAMGQSVRADDNRRTILNECVTMSSVVTGFAQYANQNSLIGYTEKTASELGWTYVWNEVSAGKVCKTMLKPDAKIWVVNGEANPLQGYLNDCYHPTIRGFKNRVIVIEKPVTPVVTPVATPTPAPQEPVCVNAPGLTIRQAQELGYMVDAQGNCSKQPEVVTNTVTETINVCPLTYDQFSFKGYASMQERIIGGKTGALISVGGSLLGTWASGGNKGDMIDATWQSAVANRAANAANPSDTGALIRFLGTDYKVKKGKPHEFNADYAIRWEGDDAWLVRQYQGQVYRCTGYSLAKNTNLAFVFRSTRDRIVEVTPTGGIKNLPVGSSTKPIPPLQPGNNLPPRTTRVTRNGWTVQ